MREFNKFGEAHRRGLVNGVEIDLSHVNRFSDLSLGIIWGLALNYKDIKCDEKLIIFPPDKGNFFKDRKFFDRLTGVATKNPLSSAVPLNLETFNPSRPNSVYLNADKDIEKVFNQAAASFLSSDNSFHKELKTHMYEVITNSFDHSELQLEAGVICTLNKNGLLDFCVIDRGQGIKNSFLKNPILKNVYASMSDGQIINKATDLGVSCNPKIARNLNYKYTNGGIGLYFLRE
ncbi:MAG: hypothetical protein Q8Q91_01315, partial [Candidatus Daviesbacteria bacterium]|nr:hypothetical protein [Candidatus Daviesbacteria bacterium]